MKSARPLIILVLIVSLALAGAARQWAYADREQTHVGPALPSAGATQSDASLSSMNTYALALLLGGLRGPLVMFLWPSSELQKTQHNLEDFDTKVEWIRLLQPEFDTVHLYQIWNKAYNISVQMASLPNKYATILDALDYAHNVDIQKPDDINIIVAIAQLFSDKLGNSQEKTYYTRRVRLETQAYQDLVRVTLPEGKLADFILAARKAGMDQPIQPAETDNFSHTTVLIVTRAVADAVKLSFTAQGAKFDAIPRPEARTDRTLKRRRLDPMLDEAGNILPALLVVRYPRPADVPADAWYDGSTLQFLPAYGPFPYGLSPQAIAFSYYRRAQMLGRVAHQTHIQVSDVVIDSRPALTLKAWGAEEADRGRRAELRLFGVDDQGDPTDLENRAPGASPLAAPPGPAQFADRPDPAAAAQALYSYGIAARLYRDSRQLLIDHVKHFPVSTTTYNSHIDETRAFEPLYQADHDFLDGVLNPDHRKQSWAAAVPEYIAANQGFELVVLKYFVSDDVAANLYPVDPKTKERYNRFTIEQMDPADRGNLIDAVLKLNARLYRGVNVDQFRDERTEELNYCNRALARLNAMGVAPATRPTAPTQYGPSLTPASGHP